MHDRSGRLLLVLGVLVLVWVAVYWVWQPGGASADPLITFDDRPPAQPPSPPRPASQALREAENPGRAPTPGLPAGASAPPPDPVAPRFRSYTVGGGDTMERIAHRELGRASLWTAIAQANPLKDPTRLKPGEVLRIPLDPDNIQGGLAAAPAGTAPTTVTYTVAAGDTLEKIARAYYGSGGFAEYIYFHNRETLRNKDDLRIGQQLLLPPPEGD